MNAPQSASVAPRVKAAWLVRLRRLLAVPVAAALVLGAPGLAYATFTARTTAALNVGTYTVPAPASIGGTLVCTTDQGKKGAAISFTGFAAVSRATGYTATLTSPTGPQAVTEIAPEDTTHEVKVLSKGNGKGTYTFTFSARVGPWTGPDLQQSVTC
ncbi:hypothetical protein [Arthrobacter sp. NicSoilC12]|uniref:hypothetical protein n=1 Tax=Arthrobacter sp. NicSoilC12 TaxID=2831001 RepID=UPI001CC63D5C|nr:hypothetical protein [Arthrobacter sp. NicSoilC12]GIU56618.1 hypothetical protein NicSoilC12_23670 [Arthrobacter sp. NicSoilC12]